jgi:signal transduction histidine kinase
VLPDSGPGTLGTVALSRSTARLEARVSGLWTMLMVVAVAGLAAAGLIASGLARWVSRPLAALEGAAQHLGGGALDTRSPTDRGPREVRSLAVSFNTMAARLQALIHGHQVMMADVSHQLRTPLAALRLRLDLLAQDADEPIATELAGAQGEIARLSRMVSGLLAVAHAENVTAAGVTVAVDCVARDRAAAWRPAAEERSVRLVDTGLRPARARAGEGHLEQMLDNLLANAIEALAPGGTIWMTTAPAGGQVSVEVADDGPGMTPQQRQTAFRRFATGTRGGTGLGLAIVDRLAVANGGSVSLSDTPGGGLTVRIELPAAGRDRALRRRAP